MHESEEDIYVAPPLPSLSRRQMRRRAAAERRAAHMPFDHNHDDGDNVDDELELELDVALGNS